MSITKKDCFTINCETNEEGFEILLKMSGYTAASFAKYMQVEEKIIKETPIWAFKYLEDLLDAELAHLGYVMKDAKVSGIVGTLRNLEKKIKENRAGGTLEGDLPIIIPDTIITESGPIKIHYIARAEQLLENFITNQKEP